MLTRRWTKPRSVPYSNRPDSSSEIWQREVSGYFSLGGPGISERFSSRGCAFGDYDNDGDVDVLVFNMNDAPLAVA